MDAPKPSSINDIFLLNIKKDLISDQGNDFSIHITFNNNKFIILAEKKGKLFKENYKNEYTIDQIQEINNYFNLFSNANEILKEFKDRIDSKNPILNECNNDKINLIIFLPITKYKQIEFNLNKDIKTNEGFDELKSIIRKLYDKVEELTKENKEIKARLEKMENERGKNENKNEKIETFSPKVNKFRWINKEVNIVNKSKFLSSHDADIMLNKNYSKPYSCTIGDKNHFVEFSFIKTYFLKSIGIKVEDFDCSLKTFSVEVISENGKRKNIGKFIRVKYSDNKDFQDFEINQECKGVKLYLMDNWGSQGGDHILISRIDFYVSD